MRRRKNEALPKYVCRRSYGVIYTPYLGQGKKGKPVNLGPADMSVTEIWAAYERETKQSQDTLRWLLAEYHSSKKYQALKPKTQKAYGEYRDKLLEAPMRNGKPFGGAQLDKIKRPAIQAYLDKADAPIHANRQIQYLKAAWNWAMNRYDHMPENPCIGVELNKQEARTRYVTQEEFASFKATTTGYIPIFMELGYLLRARWSEVAALTHSDVLDRGIRLLRSKGSEGEITAWSPRLMAAVEAAKSLNPEAPTPIEGAYLVHDKRGRPIKQNSFQSAWGRAQRKWAKKPADRFAYHDLKAAGVSDQKDNFGGHRSEKMRKVYVRKLQVVEPPK